MKTELKSNEEVSLTLRKHWFTLIGPILLTTILLLIALTGSQSEYGKYFMIGGVITILWLIYRIYDRKTNIWVITNYRVIDEYGVFSINSKECSLDKINNVSYKLPFIGRIFNFGHVQIQTSAEMGATVTRMVEKPKLLKNTITNKQEEYQQGKIKEQAQNLANEVGNSQSSKTDVADELTKLHDLKEKGIITEEEYNQRKAKILNS